MATQATRESCHSDYRMINCLEAIRSELLLRRYDGISLPAIAPDSTASERSLTVLVTPDAIKQEGGFRQLKPLADPA
ncbi:MAG: hypothetical protein ACM37W_14850 [Actinomycetota bacterium]